MRLKIGAFPQQYFVYCKGKQRPFSAKAPPDADDDIVRCCLSGRGKHKLYLAEMERDLLKKLDEIERRDAFRK